MKSNTFNEKCGVVLLVKGVLKESGAEVLWSILVFTLVRGES